MLVPLDMNGKKIMNTNFDLKFGDIFKIIKCILINDPLNQNVYAILYDNTKKKVVFHLSVFRFQLFYIHLFYQVILINFLKHS